MAAVRRAGGGGGGRAAGVSAALATCSAGLRRPGLEKGAPRARVGQLAGAGAAREAAAWAAAGRGGRSPLG